MDNDRKNEILEKSRQSKQDEGVENARMRGFKFGDRVATWVVGIPLSALSAFTGQYNVAWALLTYMAVFEFGAAVTTYRFTKNKIYLIIAVGMALFTVFTTFIFVSNVLEWRWQI